MSKLNSVSICIMLCLAFNITRAQSPNKNIDSLNGTMNLEIDISAMKDTAGVFDLHMAGVMPPRVVKNNNKLFVNYNMSSPRRASLLFIPRDTLNKYPGKSTSEIVVRYEDLYEFFAQPGPVKIVVKNDLVNSEIIGLSRYQMDYVELSKKEDQFQQDITSANATLINQINSAQNKQLRDSLNAIFQRKAIVAYQKYLNDVVFDYIERNPDSPVSLQELFDCSQEGFIDMDATSHLYGILSDRLKKSDVAKFISKRIDNSQFGKSLIGKDAPDFTLQGVDGKHITLSQYKGRVILLDFWASWCGACRANNPGLVETYQKYKNKNFDIIGISMDLEKDSWLEAIAKDKLSWYNARELTAVEVKVGKLYHVYELPNNFLIDKDGKVLAQNVDVKQLNELLARLCN